MKQSKQIRRDSVWYRISRLVVATCFVVVTFASLVIVFSAPSLAAVTPPNKMNFQGRLTDASGNPLTGTYDMQLKLYSAATGGTLLWAETRTAANTNAVTVTSGLFSVRLGEGTLVAPSTQLNAVVAANATLYFEITIGADAAMTPRSQLATSAYAFSADTLDGIDSTGFIQNQNTAVQSAANLWMGGTARVDTSVLTPSLDTATATTLSIGTATTTGITIGKVGVTTTILGSTLITPQTSTSTTMLCSNAGVISTCDSGLVAPTGTNFIRNQTGQQASSDFNISGTGVANVLQAATSVATPLVDVVSGSLSLGTGTATSITLGKTGVGTTAAGTLTSTGLLTGNGGATVSGAVTLNTSGANAVSINTGTATGTTSIGNGAAGAINLQSASTVGITGTTSMSGLTSGTGVALSVTNSTSTGSILELKDSTTSVFTVADGGAVVAKNTSTAAFAIQNASGYSVLTADTSTNYRLVLGTPGGDTTGTLLVLGNKTNEGDPTGVEGAMYYNSSMKSFRCYRDGMWDDCSTHNIERQWVVEDEFFSGHNFFDVAPGGYFDGEIGSLNWHGYVFGGSGTVTLRHNSTYVQPTADRPGTLNLIATAVDMGATVFLGDDEDDAGLGYAVRLAAGNVFKTAVKAEYANFDGYMGLHNQRKTSGTPTEGVWFGVDSSTDRWQLCYYGKRLSGDSNGAQCLTTGVSTSTNWTRLEFRIVSLTTGAVTIDYYIDGVKYTPTSNGSIYSVVSTNGVTPAIQFENDRSGSAQMAIDYVQVRGTSSAAR